VDHHIVVPAEESFVVPDTAFRKSMLPVSIDVTVQDELASLLFDGFGEDCVLKIPLSAWLRVEKGQALSFFEVVVE
jgi:hypothetical protein